MKCNSKLNFTVLLLVALLISSCTEEKAKSLQLAAESFKNEADIACTMGANSINASVAMPARTRSEIANSLEQSKVFGAEELDLIYSDSSIVNEGLQPAQDALNNACEAHRQLAAIYTDLPRGYLLSTDDVKRAQKHVVNVTVRFAKLAQVFASLPDVGRDNVARIKIIEAHEKAMAVSDEKQRLPLLDIVAGEILTNQVNETNNRNQVMGQFAKAVALGEKLARASVDYDKLSLSDLLETFREFSTLYGNITGRTENAKAALDRINNTETRIKNDPILSPLLDADLIQ